MDFFNLEHKVEFIPVEEHIILNAVEYIYQKAHLIIKSYNSSIKTLEITINKAFKDVAVYSIKALNNVIFNAEKLL